MLKALTIKNIVLIERAEILFGDALSVLTGETGAGKSILLDSLGIALGKRSQPRLVRHGEEQGSASAEFDISNNEEVKNILKEQGVEAENEVILRRVIYANGKSKSFANGEVISASALQKMGEKLVEIHGQHDQRGLLNPATHMQILDDYGELKKYVEQVTKLYKNWKKLQKEYDDLYKKSQKEKEDEEYLRHVISELEELSPVVGEEAVLSEKRSFLMNAEKIIESLKSASGELTGKNDVARSIRNAERVLQRSSHAELFESALEALDRASVEVDEAILSIESCAREINIDDCELDSAEERLFALRAVARKYSKSVDELEQYLEEVKANIGLLESDDRRLLELEKQLVEAKEKYKEVAQKLHNKRIKSASEIEKIILKELIPLKMENSRLKAEVKVLDEVSWSSSGIDKVSFLVSTNLGSPFGSMAKIASGGELSRFMLAMKVVLSDVKSVSTLIFDEIDTGVGGAVADAVGKRLKKLAQNTQVLCVTHQPQVAACGAYHLKIEKSSVNGKTTTKVIQLDLLQRKEEMARMLSGKDITEEARAQALKLMEA